MKFDPKKKSYLNIQKGDRHLTQKKGDRQDSRLNKRSYLNIERLKRNFSNTSYRSKKIQQNDVILKD